MDHKLTQHKTHKREFKTQKEFQRTKQRKNKHYKKRHATNHYNGYDYNRANYRKTRQHGYSYFNRGWSLAYRYDRASFYDNQGYYYGYFNRHGYYFEDVFYRYDRYYGYTDRVKGRGLFDHRYYMPNKVNYYGFCDTRYNDRNREISYTRGYDRY